MSGIPHRNKDSAKGAFVDTSCITPLPSSQLLNEYTVKHDPHCMDNIARNNYNTSDYWHRFTVSNESYSCSEYPKNFILKVITDFVYPCELLPLHVSQKANKTFFLARNCLSAIIKLCEADLCVNNPNKPHSPFKIVIIKDILTINHIPVVNVETNILEVLNKRISNDLLDLSGFYEDRDLSEFCPLSQPKLLLYVLSLSASVKTAAGNNIVKIKLSHNDIKHLPNLESLSDRGFCSIDLSHNKIQNIEDIVPLKYLKDLVSLHLEGNPLCRRFDSGLTYFLYVRTICKNLRTLDKRRLWEDGFYKKHRTFLCDPKGFDFANQFIEQYFTYFDEINRPNLSSFYSENAMFSISYRYTPPLRSNHFWGLNRNLIDGLFAKLFCGKAAVMEQLYGIPPIKHHPHTFFVDLMTYSKTQAIIYITGAFKDFGPKQSRVLFYGFTRNFVLSSKDGKEWVINNDQWHVYVPYRNKGGLFPWPTPNAPSLFPEPNFNPDHMNALTLTFASITGMGYEHSKKFLEKNNWNLELALKVFIDEHINDEIPVEAFIEDVEQIQEVDSDDDVIVTEDDILPPLETLLIDTPKLTSDFYNKNQTAITSSQNRKSTQNQFKSPVVNNPTNLNTTKRKNKGSKGKPSRAGLLPTPKF